MIQIENKKAAHKYFFDFESKRYLRTAVFRVMRAENKKAVHECLFDFGSKGYLRTAVICSILWLMRERVCSTQESIYSGEAVSSGGRTVILSEGVRAPSLPLFR